jgi:hypothetical protein
MSAWTVVPQPTTNGWTPVQGAKPSPESGGELPFVPNKSLGTIRNMMGTDTGENMGTVLPNGKVHSSMMTPMMQGVARMAEPGMDAKAKGASMIVEDAGKALAPLAAPALIAAPAATVLGAAGGLGGAGLARAGADYFHAPEGVRDLATDAGGLAGGALGARIPGAIKDIPGVAPLARWGIKHFTPLPGPISSALAERMFPSVGTPKPAMGPMPNIPVPAPAPPRSPQRFMGPGTAPPQPLPPVGPQRLMTGEAPALPPPITAQPEARFQVGQPPRPNAPAQPERLMRGESPPLPPPKAPAAEEPQPLHGMEAPPLPPRSNPRAKGMGKSTTAAPTSAPETAPSAQAPNGPWTSAPHTPSPDDKIFTAPGVRDPNLAQSGGVLSAEELRNRQAVTNKAIPVLDKAGITPEEIEQPGAGRAKAMAAFKDHPFDFSARQRNPADYGRKEEPSEETWQNMAASLRQQQQLRGMMNQPSQPQQAQGLAPRQQKFLPFSNASVKPEEMRIQNATPEEGNRMVQRFGQTRAGEDEGQTDWSQWNGEDLERMAQEFEDMMDKTPGMTDPRMKAMARAVLKPMRDTALRELAKRRSVYGQ